MRIVNTSAVFRGLAAAMALVAMLGLNGCEEEDSSADGNATLLPDRFRITVYYTPVESFHDGDLVAIRGETSIDGEGGQQPLGAYPASFIEAVRMEGVGRITSGAYAGKYLNGSFGGGFWISDYPPDAYESSLRAFKTAAADDDVMARGTRFRLVEPFAQPGGWPVESAVVRRLRSTVWEVQDHFEAGYGGQFHLDLYVGEQDRYDFTSSPWYIALENAGVEVF